MHFETPEQPLIEQYRVWPSTQLWEEGESTERENFPELAKIKPIIKSTTKPKITSKGKRLNFFDLFFGKKITYTPKK
jgi:hypothetical protein